VASNQAVQTFCLYTFASFCTDLDKYYQVFNEEYRKHFTTELPPQVFLGVACLVRGAHFETQGIAVRRPEWREESPRR